MREHNTGGVIMIALQTWQYDKQCKRFLIRLFILPHEFATLKHKIWHDAYSFLPFFRWFRLTGRWMWVYKLGIFYGENRIRRSTNAEVLQFTSTKTHARTHTQTRGGSRRHTSRAINSIMSLSLSSLAISAVYISPDSLCRSVCVVHRTFSAISSFYCIDFAMQIRTICLFFFFLFVSIEIT